MTGAVRKFALWLLDRASMHRSGASQDTAPQSRAIFEEGHAPTRFRHAETELDTKGTGRHHGAQAGRACVFLARACDTGTSTTNETISPHGRGPNTRGTLQERSRLATCGGPACPGGPGC